MLGWRLVMSAILVPAIVALFWLDQRLGKSALILLGFCLFVAVRNAYELSDLLNVRNIRPHFWLVVPGGPCRLGSSAFDK